VAKIAIAITKSKVASIVMSDDDVHDCCNKNIFSRWQKVAIEGDDWTRTGKVFQTVAAAIKRNKQLKC